MGFNAEAMQYVLNNRDVNGFNVYCLLDINVLFTSIYYNSAYFVFIDEHLWFSKLEIFVLFLDCNSI
jgi:hypothetical protein